MHTARKINPFLLSSVLYSGIPASAIILLRKQLQRTRLEILMTIKTRAFANTTKLPRAKLENTHSKNVKSRCWSFYLTAQKRNIL